MITTAGDILMGKMDFKLNVIAELLIDVMLIFIVNEILKELNK